MTLVYRIIVLFSGYTQSIFDPRKPDRLQGRYTVNVICSQNITKMKEGSINSFSDSEIAPPRNCEEYMLDVQFACIS